MMNLRETTIEINDAKNFQGLFQVYEELAAQKMQVVRDEIISYRSFYQFLTSVSDEIGKDITNVISKKSKIHALILISSDKGLYGNAFNETVKLFLDTLEKQQTDAFVIGSIGTELLKISGTNQKYTVIPSDKESIKEFWNSINQYQNIDICYLKFNSIAKQTVNMIHLAGDIIPQNKADYTINQESSLSFLYEPSVFEVAEVFTSKILSFLTEQTFKESDLAKYAARLMYLDNCIEKNKKHLILANNRKMILKKRQQNKRQNARMVNYITRSRGGYTI